MHVKQGRARLLVIFIMAYQEGKPRSSEEFGLHFVVNLINI